ncbi:hypothetical protein E4Z66_11965 [Aliishimia ponticola]|uniref:AAA+ family ATPase n=1 Tax=Aliishimia ponticola TaxID=2499833 RepID=A0A4S4N972_9RHOB|nr:hypothetical protein [Aliishimia ponticola]THH35792.1 hypothetical protein E4Z66_11965 [Aliishimia ponticola]
MRRISLIIAVTLACAAPVHAQDTGTQDGAAEGGLSLIERGARLFMEGMLKEIEPAFEQIGPAFKEFVDEMGPAFVDLLDQVKDWSAYHPPEMLDNGDIIMRRKVEPPVQDDPMQDDPVPEDRGPNAPTANQDTPIDI